MHLLKLRTCVALLLGSFCSVVAAVQSPSPLESRRKALNDLLAEQWEYRLRTSPLFASFLGDKRWNDKLDDFSQEAIEDRKSTRLNSSHTVISYAVFCLKKKKQHKVLSFPMR